MAILVRDSGVALDAQVAASEGAHSVATRLFAATDGVREATQASIIPMYAPRFRRFVDQLRREMGEAAFDREWTRGRELGLEGAAQLGLAWARRGIEQAAADESADALRVGTARLDGTSSEQ